MRSRLSLSVRALTFERRLNLTTVGGPISLGLALGVCLPVVALTQFDGVALLRTSWAIKLVTVPDGEWARDWSTKAQTVAQMQEAAFEGALWLLFVLAITVWLAALIGTELGSLRTVLAERRTWAIHSAVGATRRNLRLALLARGLKTLAIVCGLGLLLAAAAAETLVRFLPPSVELVGWSGASTVFTSPMVLVVLGVTAVVLITGPLLVPTRARSTNVRRSSRETEAWSDASWLLAVGQIATSVLLAMCVLLLVGSATATEETAATYPHGRDTLVLRARLPAGVHSAATWLAAREAVMELPGVEAVAVSSPGAVLGLGVADRGGAYCPYCTSGGLSAPVMTGRVRHMVVDEAFFAILGFGNDRPVEEGSVIINPALARQWFQNTGSVGLRIWLRGVAPLRGSGYRVASIVRAPPPNGFGAARMPLSAAYLPLGEHSPSNVDILIRSHRSSEGSLEIGDRGGHVGLTGAIKEAIQIKISGIQVELLGPLDELVAAQAAPVRWLARWMVGLGAAALLLSLVGLSGATIDRVRARRAEIGLRLAVGARRVQIVKLVLADSAKVVAAGALLGAALGAGVNRGLPSVIGGVDPLPIEWVVTMISILVLVGLTGAANAAVHATRLDPVAALRDGHW